ncbi:hypothetical protein NADFUDRAFT_51594 [Nadsonia fulvescens var. elongata DSM 6958]|uniref:Uncharacterized protein n=1 Tax=Nadsonia fulvescens var. elongata DSM 6958 TaxID=857566 RepID=A0A1E3PHV9_9ASCO|nr:hypothetical protein NADFUDRAFT_51594 [Nadsonia fulvescens var. elongata DSM 6958]
MSRTKGGSDKIMVTTEANGEFIYMQTEWTKLLLQTYHHKLKARHRCPISFLLHVPLFNIGRDSLHYESASSSYSPFVAGLDDYENFLPTVVRPNLQKKPYINNNGISNMGHLIVSNNNIIEDASIKDFSNKKDEGKLGSIPKVGALNLAKSGLFTNYSSISMSNLRLASVSLNELLKDNTAKTPSFKIHAIYSAYSTDSDELVSNLFSHFTQVFDSGYQEEKSSDSDIFCNTIAYWINYNQGFSIKDSVWREYALKNDEILFTVGSFLVGKAESQETKNIEPVLSFLCLISNYKISSFGYQITYALLLLARVGNDMVVTLIKDIMENLMTGINIPAVITNDTRKVLLDSSPDSFEAYYEKLIIIFNDASLDERQSAVKIISYLANFPTMHMVSEKDYFNKVIHNCLLHRAGVYAIRPSHWLLAALECPKIYHRFKEYFELKLREGDALIGSPVLKLFNFMKSHLIFLKEFNLILPLLALFRLSGNLDSYFREEYDLIFFKLFTQEEVSFFSTLKHLGLSLGNKVSILEPEDTALVPLISRSPSLHRRASSKPKKSVTWNPTLVVFDPTKKVEVIGPSYYTTLKRIMARVSRNYKHAHKRVSEGHYNGESLRDKEIRLCESQRTRLTKMAEQNTTKGKLGSQSKAEGLFKVQPAIIEESYRHWKIKESSASEAKKSMLHAARKIAFMERAIKHRKISGVKVVEKDMFKEGATNFRNF